MARAGGKKTQAAGQMATAKDDCFIFELEKHNRDFPPPFPVLLTKVSFSKIRLAKPMFNKKAIWFLLVLLGCMLTVDAEGIGSTVATIDKATPPRTLLADNSVSFRPKRRG